MQRRIRTVAVTAALIVAGGIFGTIAGTLVLLAWQVSFEGLGSVSPELPWLLGLGVVIGGGLGAVLGPLAAWVLMRNVPLWLAVGGTTLATVLAGGLTLVITSEPVGALLLGAMGFAGTAAALNHRFSDAQQQRMEP